MDTVIHQALTAFQQRDLDITDLVVAAEKEVAEHPERRQAVAGELASAFQAGAISANDLATVMQALALSHRKTSVVRDVELDGVVDAQATEFVAQAKTVAAIGVNSAEPVRGRSIDTVTEAFTSVPEPIIGARSLQPGDVLKNRFELEDEVGSGGMGKVFRAKDRVRVQAEDRNPYVALKVLGEAFSQHPDSVMAMQREARNSQALSHPNIVRVHDFDWDEQRNCHYISMEFLRGTPLDKRVLREDQSFVQDVWPIVSGVGEALAYAHEHKIVHSDIKPSNIWITDAAEVKVLDFGIARALDPDTKTNWAGVAAVSPPYASPEQLRREEPDARDDVYGLACVAYELLVGERPFGALDAARAQSEDLAPAKPANLKPRQWRALERALRLDRTQRTPTVRQFLVELSPDKPPMPLKYVLLASLVVSVAVGLVVTWLKPAESSLSDEDVYLGRLLETRVVEPISEVIAANRQDEGLYFLDSGTDDLANGEYQRGNTDLKNGASTAFLPFYQVLRGSNNEVQRKAAANGILRIDMAYLRTIEHLRGLMMPQKALWLACQSLATPPGTRAPRLPVLKHAYRELWSEVKGSAAPPIDRGCNTKNVPESWGDRLHMRSPPR